MFYEYSTLSIIGISMVVRGSIDRRRRAFDEQNVYGPWPAGVAHAVNVDADPRAITTGGPSAININVQIYMAVTCITDNECRHTGRTAQMTTITIASDCRINR